MPSLYKPANVPTIDTGIASSVIKVARTFCKNRNMTRIPNNIASKNVPGSLGVAALITCALFATATGIVGKNPAASPASAATTTAATTAARQRPQRARRLARLGRLGAEHRRLARDHVPQQLGGRRRVVLRLAAAAAHPVRRGVVGCQGPRADAPDGRVASRGR